jgi:hypothetical protein
VYGLGYLSLEKEPVVIQVPDFGDRFWTVPMYDARTDQISEIGLQYGTKPGFYMIVGTNWKGATPSGIAGVVRSFQFGYFIFQYSIIPVPSSLFPK